MYSDSSNAAWAVERYCSVPKAIYWKAALCILACIKGPRQYGVIHQSGTMGSI